MFKLSLAAVVITFSFISLSCSDKPKEKVQARIYSQDFKTDVAWVVLEWNGQPRGYGSGFLVDKEKGAFFTNKHVSVVFNAFGRGSHKIFFNGRVYNAEVVQTPPLVDAALIKITDSFNSYEFPEPHAMSSEEVKVGDQIFIEGFHPHWYWVRESDQADGYSFPIIPVYKDYYNLGTKHLDKEKEVIFEKLEGRVTAINKKISIGGQGSGMVQNTRDVVNLYLEIKTAKDHKFPFGGLSGTVVRNTKGETVGIFTAGPEEEYDPDTVEKVADDLFTAKQVFKTAYITPIKTAKDLVKYLK